MFLNYMAFTQSALELIESLRTFDLTDPVKYDFALFGLGVNKNILFDE